MKISTAVKSFVALPLTIGALNSEATKRNFFLHADANETCEVVKQLRVDLRQVVMSNAGSVDIVLEPKPLSYLEENRFHKLAIKEAIGTITDVERKEMEALDARRTVDKPMAADAVIARERLFSKIDELFEKLNYIRS